MFLQTLVQLNILILAAPALAGWTLLPLTQPGAVRAACVVWQGRTVEAVAPRSEQVGVAKTRQAARPQPLALPRFVSPGVVRPVHQDRAFVAAPAVLASFNPFPHATRAP